MSRIQPQVDLKINLIKFFSYMDSKQMSSSQLADFFETPSQSIRSKSNTIQTRRLILRYQGYTCRSFEVMQNWLRSKFDDHDLRIMKTSWTTQNQIFYIYLSRKRKLSLSRWCENLSQSSVFPSIMIYDKQLYTAMMNDFTDHWPQRIQDQLKQILRKERSIEEIVDKNILNIMHLSKIIQNVTLYQSKKREEVLKNLNYPKKRGLWFFGLANSGKTTLAVKYLGQNVYYKDVTTETFDEYRGQQCILIDQLNISNAKKLLPILKNLINITPGRLNVKFSTIVIHPKVVAVTTQYSLQMLTKDESLKHALAERFRFFFVSRDGSITNAKQFKQKPGDLLYGDEYFYMEKNNKVMTRSEFYLYERDALEEALYNSIGG